MQSRQGRRARKKERPRRQVELEPQTSPVEIEAEEMVVVRVGGGAEHVEVAEFAEGDQRPGEAHPRGPRTDTRPRRPPPTSKKQATLAPPTGVPGPPSATCPCRSLRPGTAGGRSTRPRKGSTWASGSTSTPDRRRRDRTRRCRCWLPS